MMDLRKKMTTGAKRVVVKLGSSVLAGRAHGADYEMSEAGQAKLLGEIVGDLSLANGPQMVLVSSGSVALGMKALGMKERPKSIPEIQALAAVGQGELMTRYNGLFQETASKCAQVLLTHDDLSDRSRFLNARNTIFSLLALGIVPIINENDTVAVEEIKFGDNDTLAALATNLVEADLLIVLTDIDGLYDANPVRDADAKRVPLVEDVDSLDMESMSSESGHFGTGGITSKIEAARKAAHFGVATVVASGFTPGIIKKILAGDDAGTLFLPREDRLTSKKHWIAFSTRPTGRVFLDEGALRALVENGKSLLPSGITKVDGTFESGEVIHCMDSSGMELARGISNYSSREIESIRGRKTGEIEEILGYRVYDEVIHRDNLVIL